MNDGAKKRGGAVTEKQWISKSSREFENGGVMSRKWEAQRVLHCLNNAELAFIVTVTKDIKSNHT